MRHAVCEATRACAPLCLCKMCLKGREAGPACFTRQTTTTHPYFRMRGPSCAREESHEAWLHTAESLRLTPAQQAEVKQLRDAYLGDIDGVLVRRVEAVRELVESGTHRVSMRKAALFYLKVGEGGCKGGRWWGVSSTSGCRSRGMADLHGAGEYSEADGGGGAAHRSICAQTFWGSKHFSAPTL